MTIHDATVNDNRVTFTESAKGTERETTARRAASDLERDCDAVKRVSAGVGERVTVWLAHCAISKKKVARLSRREARPRTSKRIYILT